MDLELSDLEPSIPSWFSDASMALLVLVVSGCFCWSSPVSLELLLGGSWAAVVWQPHVQALDRRAAIRCGFSPWKQG